LAHEKERIQIAAQGHAEALEHHTYTRRAAEIASVMVRCLKSPDSTGPVSGLECSLKNVLTSTRFSNTPDLSTPTKLWITKNDHPKEQYFKNPLRIFAAFSQTNWEDYNLQPGLAHFGEVIRFDWKDRYDQYDPQWHWSQKQRMNLELLDRLYQAHRRQPVDLFFSYLSGRLIFPGFIHTINRMNIPSLNISLDDKAKFWGELEPTGYSGMGDIASAFTLCWTTDKSALAHYREVGAEALYMPAAADPDIFRPLDLPKTMDVIFVGQNYGQRSTIVEQLRDRGIAVQTFGAGWKNGPVTMTEMVRLFSQSKIVLGMGLVGDSSELVGLKGRDFEVPMCGALYLTHANPDLAEFFALDREIVCYRSFSDLVEKIEFFLAHPGEADAVRQAAFERSRREHTWIQRFQQAFKILASTKSEQP